MNGIEPQRILVRCPNWVGDVVMATPTLRALRDAFPKARLEVAMKRYVAPLLTGWDVVDEIVEIDRFGSGLGALRRAGRHLRERRYDVAVLLTNSLSTALEVTFARIPRRIGYGGEGRRFLLTDVLARPPRTKFGYREPMPMVDYYLATLHSLGVTEASRRYELPCSPEQDAWAAEWCARHELGDRPIVGVNPGAKFGASKHWQPEKFAAAADRVAAEIGGIALLLGGPGEEAQLAEIAGMMRGPVVDSGLDVIPLAELKAVVRRLALLLTTDTGTRAVAQAFDVPHVAILGPTHPGFTNANLEKARTVRHDVPCGPCHLKSCPIDHACMQGVTVDEVVEAATALLR